MADKKKDIWEKISETAAATGKSIGDEYQKLKLSHDIWLLDRDLHKAYAHVGRIIYDRHKSGNLQADSELKPIFDDIAQLKDAIKKQAERRENICTPRETTSQTAPSETCAEKPNETGAQPIETRAETSEHKAEMEFLDDTTAVFSCPECGATFNIDSGMVPNFCMQCGKSFGRD